MRIIASVAALLTLGGLGFAASINPSGVPVDMVVTAVPVSGQTSPAVLQPNEVAILLGRTPAPVVTAERLAGDHANMQLYVLLDDSTRSSSLSLQLGELRKYVQSLPPTTEVAIGYMRNGSAVPAQGFTTDHEKAAAALRLPMSIPGGNGSPYFALSDVAKHWPSKDATGRRVVLMLTDGVDRYFGTSMEDDPYLDASVHDALKKGIMVYSIYLRGAGFYGSTGRERLFAQSRLMQTGEQTGGHAYFQDLTDPVSIAPFLKDLQNRFDNQYRVTVQAFDQKGVQPVKVRSAAPGLKIEGPTEIYVP